MERFPAHMIRAEATAKQMPMETQAPRPVRPRIVTVIGWVWLVVGAQRCAVGLLGLLVWKVGGARDLVPFVASHAPVAIDASVRYATEIMVAQTLAAGFLAYAAFELLRLKRWAKTTIEVASWIGVALSVGTGVFVYATTARVAAATPEAAETIRIVGVAAGLGVAVVGAVLFAATIFLLRRPAVAAAFETPA